MNPTLADLAELERELEDYEATLIGEPEGGDQMDRVEMQRRINNMVEGLDAVRVSHGGSIGAVRLG